MSQFTPDTVVSLPVSSMDSFFKYWFAFLKPLHKLTNKQMEVAACFAKHRYYLSLKINDDELLDKVLFNEDTKRAIREECGVTPVHFQVLISHLRKKNIVTEKGLNKRFIPKFKVDGNSFKLALVFTINE